MRKALFFLASALLLAGCAKEAPVAEVSEGTVRFTTNILTYAFKATDTAFENGDAVGVFAGAPINKQNVKGTVAGSALTFTAPIKWIEGDNGVVEFLAYYPYTESATTSLAFTVNADQTGNGYTRSDLMIAKKSSAPTEDPVALEFRHSLSKVVFNIDNQIAGTTVTGVSIRNVAAGATIDLREGTVSDLGAATATIKAQAASATQYQAILIPQSATPTVTVSLSSGERYAFSLENAFAFKAGKKASATLTVSEAAEGGAVTFSFSVLDWDEDTDELAFGDPSKEDTAEAWHVMGLGGDWETGIAMTEDEYGNWSADITYAADDEFKLKKGDTWVGMQPGWLYYGLGDFGNDTNYLQADDAAFNIVLEAAGDYNLFFAPDTNWFVVTAK